MDRGHSMARGPCCRAAAPCPCPLAGLRAGPWLSSHGSLLCMPGTLGSDGIKSCASSGYNPPLASGDDGGCAPPRRGVPAGRIGARRKASPAWRHWRDAACPVRRKRRRPARSAAPGRRSHRSRSSVFGVRGVTGGAIAQRPYLPFTRPNSKWICLRISGITN